MESLGSSILVGSIGSISSLLGLVGLESSSLTVLGSLGSSLGSSVRVVVGIGIPVVLSIGLGRTKLVSVVLVGSSISPTDSSVLVGTLASIGLVGSGEVGGGSLVGIDSLDTGGSNLAILINGGGCTIAVGWGIPTSIPTHTATHSWGGSVPSSGWCVAVLREGGGETEDGGEDEGDLHLGSGMGTKVGISEGLILKLKFRFLNLTY
jgi:hypothetical protein